MSLWNIPHLSSLVNGKPAGANLVLIIFNSLRTLVNGNLTAENFRDYSLTGTCFADEAIEAEHFPVGSIGAASVSGLTQEQLQVNGNGHIHFDMDLLDGKAPEEIGCLGVQKRTITIDSGTELTRWRHAAKDYFAFVIDEEFTAEDFGLTAFPNRYRVAVQADAAPAFTHDRYGLMLGDNPLPAEYQNVARTMSGWGVWEQASTSFRAGCRGVLVKERSPVSILGAFWKAPAAGLPAPVATEMRDWVNVVNMKVAVLA